MLSNWFVGPTFAAVAAGSKIVQAGDTGDTVRKLQGALIALGYGLPGSMKSSGKLDGVFGNETYYRVCDFQKKVFPGKSPDGKVGKKTLGEMDARLATAPPSKGPIWGEDPAPPSVPGSPRQTDLGSMFGGKMAVKQVNDMCCWAACLEFWMKCAGGDRPRFNQSEFIAMYVGLSKVMTPPRMGGMSMAGFEQIVNPSYPVPERENKTFNYRATLRDYFGNFNADWLKRNASYEPIIVGYTIGGASHVNVVGYYEVNETPCVWVMEPWDGRFKLRNIDYYAASTRTFIIHKNII